MKSSFLEFYWIELQEKLNWEQIVDEKTLPTQINEIMWRQSNSGSVVEQYLQLLKSISQHYPIEYNSHVDDHYCCDDEDGEFLYKPDVSNCANGKTNGISENIVFEENDISEEPDVGFNINYQNNFFLFKSYFS